MIKSELKVERRLNGGIRNQDVLDIITNEVSSFYGIDRKILFMKKRNREIVTPRQMCHTLAYALTKNSLSFIGTQMGSVDHATVLHSKKAINNLIATDTKIRNEYILLEEACSGLIKSYRNSRNRVKINNKNKPENKLKDMKMLMIGRSIHDKILFNALMHEQREFGKHH